MNGWLKSEPFFECQNERAIVAAVDKAPTQQRSLKCRRRENA